VGWALTFVGATTAIIFFRATTVRSAVDLVKGLVGVNGFALPHDAAAIATTYGTDIKQAAIWLAVLLFIALVCPNTLEMLARYEPALGVKPKPATPALGGFRIPAWGPSLPWAVAISVLAGVAIFYTGGPSEFLYWQF
jgi:alginate O-acetyltransferase complex protein AlgI